jgi:hypothetical protein
MFHLLVSNEACKVSEAAVEDRNLLDRWTQYSRFHKSAHDETRAGFQYFVLVSQKETVEYDSKGFWRWHVTGSRLAV